MSRWSRWIRRAATMGLVASASHLGPFSTAQSPPTPSDLEPIRVAPAMLLPPQETSAPTTATAPVLSSPPQATEPIAPPRVETGIPSVATPKSAWLDAPPVHAAPRLGNFFVVPTGPGYYSALDWLRGIERDKAPKSAFPPFLFMHPPFYDNDFRYVDDPKYQPDLLERLHRIHLGDNWLAATGGQAWWRHAHEFNSRLTGKTNDFDLVRARVYGDLWYRDTFRVYAEFITAVTMNQDIRPLPIDENRADFLNLFVDIKVCEINCRPVYVRVGRQEMNIGSTRLISTLDWANTRRPFEGVRGFYLGDKVDVDVFFTRPVIIDNSRFDYADTNANFGGAYLTYRPQKGQSVDFYYLYLDNHNHLTQKGIEILPTLTHTLGSRYVGDRCGFLWDFEGAVQLGQRGPAPIFAGMATAGLGYNWSKLPMNPTVWGYYDWASGDQNPNVGNYNTFNQQFPFGHYYLGFLDLVGRQNIRDWNMHLYLYPTKWITFNAQYHFFSLDAAKDALYAPAPAVAYRRSPNGSAGGVVGQELDLLVNFHLSGRADLVVGYSKLNSGEFLSNTGPGRSPELFYVTYSIRW